MADRMIVVVFENLIDADQGKAALQELDAGGSLVLYASVLVQKHAGGAVTIDDKRYAPPLGTLTGTSFGSVIGLAGGPAGVAAGAMIGLLIGGLIDDDNARIGEDFVAHVSRALTPHKIALIAQVDEDSPVALDTRMEALHGRVFRQPLCEVRDQMNREAIRGLTG